MTDKTLADDLAREDELLRRRIVHATRPKGPMTMEQAAQLCERMAGHGESTPRRGDLVECTKCGASVKFGSCCDTCDEPTDH